MTRILLINGANMEWLGKREPEYYGTTTTDELDALLRDHAAAKGYDIDIVYTNHEGEALDRIYRGAREGMDGLVMNPAGFTFGSVALQHCIKAIKPIPYVEVHMTQIEQRGLHSVIAEAAKGVVFGFGTQSYILGLDAMLHLIDHRMPSPS
jgi:3-dehydroquinate dehydratase-2